jgi:hypothetical protein
MIAMLKKRLVALLLVLLAVAAVGVMVYTENKAQAQGCPSGFMDPCTGECIGTYARPLRCGRRASGHGRRAPPAGRLFKNLEWRRAERRGGWVWL